MINYAQEGLCALERVHMFYVMLSSAAVSFVIAVAVTIQI